MAVIKKKERRKDGRIPIAACLLLFILVMTVVNSLFAQSDVGSLIREIEIDVPAETVAVGSEEGDRSADRRVQAQEQEQGKNVHGTGTYDIVSSLIENRKTNTDTDDPVPITRPPKPNSNAPVPMSEDAKHFYEHHQKAMKELLNDDTIMDWNRDRRAKGKYNRWLDNFDYFEITDSATDLKDAEGYDFLYFKNDLCKVAKLFHEHRKAGNSLPHVLLVRYNQDFGAFSTDLGGLNRGIRNVTKIWKKAGCSMDFVMEYVDHPDTLAVFTNQFQIVKHDKIISIPLGLSATAPDLLLEHIHKNDDKAESACLNRTQRLMLNTNLAQKGTRLRDARQLRRNFHRQIKNTYPIYTATAKAPGPTFSGDFSSVHARTQYYDEIQRSQFLWSPPGLGLDCYRHWESLYLGAIPVLRHDNRTETDGWLANAFVDLPVAWIDSYDNLTPEYLVQEYQRIVANWKSYDYRKLTRQYWVDLAHSFIKTSNKKKKVQ